MQQPNSQIAGKFLKNFPDTWIQTFDDKQQNKSLTTLQSLKSLSNPEGWQHLISLNQQGAGIFFTPNSFHTGRKKDFCTKINSYYLEIDNRPKNEQYEAFLTSPLKPSMLVATRKSIHAYFLVDHERETKADQELIDNFSKVQSLLIDWFDGDPAIKDCSRVLRVPTFFHNKQEPYYIELLESDFHPEIKYTEMEIIEAFRPVTNKVRVKPHFWDKVSQIDCKAALRALSGTSLVNGEVYTFRNRTGGGEYIDVNGKAADCWLDEQGMIGSGQGAGPTIVQWLKFYGLSGRDIADWAKSSGLMRNEEVVVGERVAANKLAGQIGKILDQKWPFTWGTDGLDKKFAPLGYGKYIVLAGEPGSGKTAFCFDMAIKNASLGLNVLFFSLEMTPKALLFRYAREKLGYSKEDVRLGRCEAWKIDKVIEELPDSLTVFDSEIGHVPSIETIKSQIEDKDVDLIFVDNLGFIDKSDGKDENEQTANLSRELALAIRGSSCSVIVLHHFRKKSGGANIRALDELRGSGKIGDDVDFAVQVWRDQTIDTDPDAVKKTPKDKAQLLVAMNKDRDWGETTGHMVFKNKHGFDDVFTDDDPGRAYQRWMELE